MIKCDVCGDINKSGVTLPAGMKTENISDICAKCGRELDKQLAPVNQELRRQLDNAAKDVLKEMARKWAVDSAQVSDPGCGADECCPTAGACAACEGGDPNATGQ